MATSLKFDIGPFFTTPDSSSLTVPPVPRETITIAPASDTFVSGFQTVGTSEETLNLGDVSSLGYVFVKNLDSTNYVQFGATTGVYSIHVRAGEVALWPHDTATVYALANTASVDIAFWAWAAPA